MKLVLGFVSLLLTVAAVLLTIKVMQPPAKTNNLGLKPDPVRPASTHESEEVVVTAGVTDANFDRVVRQNLFHPDRYWEDPLIGMDAGTPDPDGDVTEEVEEPSDAENFELIGIARVGTRAAGVIKVIPPKPKAPVRSRRPTSRVPSRSVRPPSPPTASTSSAKDEKPTKETQVYALGDPVGETGYSLTEVRSSEVDLTHQTTGDVITLEIDKFDEASVARREEASSAAEKRAKEAEARVKAAQQQAAANAKAVSKQTNATPAQAPSPPPPPGANTTVPGATDAAADRAERLERIREQFRQRLEQRRQQQEQQQPSRP